MHARDNNVLAVEALAQQESRAVAREPRDATAAFWFKVRRQYSLQV